jgi:hypothetical protein
VSESVTCSNRAARSPRTCSMSAPSHSPVLADRSGPSPAEGCSQVLPPSRQHQPAQRQRLPRQSPGRDVAGVSPIPVRIWAG